MLVASAEREGVELVSAVLGAGPNPSVTPRPSSCSTTGSRSTAAMTSCSAGERCGRRADPIRDERLGLAPGARRAADDSRRPADRDRARRAGRGRGPDRPRPASRAGDGDDRRPAGRARRRWRRRTRSPPRPCSSASTARSRSRARSPGPSPSASSRRVVHRRGGVLRPAQGNRLGQATSDPDRHPQRRDRPHGRRPELPPRSAPSCGRDPDDRRGQGRQRRPRPAPARQAGDRYRASPEARPGRGCSSSCARVGTRRVHPDRGRVPNQPRGDRPHLRRADRDQRSRAPRSPPRRSSFSSSGCSTWPRGRRHLRPRRERAARRADDVYARLVTRCAGSGC